MSEIYITACGKKDGVGSQILSKILSLRCASFESGGITRFSSPLAWIPVRNPFTST